MTMNETFIVASAAALERKTLDAIRALQRFNAENISTRITGDLDIHSMEMRIRDLEEQGLGAWFDQVLREIEEQIGGQRHHRGER